MKENAFCMNFGFTHGMQAGQPQSFDNIVTMLVPQGDGQLLAS